MSIINRPIIKIVGLNNSIPINTIFKVFNYGTDDGVESHQTTEWEIYDSTQTNLIYSNNDPLNKLELKLDNTTLSNNTTYYVKAKFKGSNGTFSLQDSVKFTTGTNQFSSNKDLFLKIKGASYTGSSNHIKTDWWIEDTSNNIIWQDLDNHKDLTEKFIDYNLSLNTSYIAKYKYYGENEVSNEDSISFTTINKHIIFEPEHIEIKPFIVDNSILFKITIQGLKTTDKLLKISGCILNIKDDTGIIVYTDTKTFDPTYDPKIVFENDTNSLLDMNKDYYVEFYWQESNTTYDIYYGLVHFNTKNITLLTINNDYIYPNVDEILNTQDLIIELNKDNLDKVISNTIEVKSGSNVYSSITDNSIIDKDTLVLNIDLTNVNTRLNTFDINYSITSLFDKNNPITNLLTNATSSRSHIGNNLEVIDDLTIKNFCVHEADFNSFFIAPYKGYPYFYNYLFTYSPTYSLTPVITKDLELRSTIDNSILKTFPSFTHDNYFIVQCEDNYNKFLVFGGNNNGNNQQVIDPTNDTNNDYDPNFYIIDKDSVNNTYLDQVQLASLNLKTILLAAKYIGNNKVAFIHNDTYTGNNKLSIFDSSTNTITNTTIGFGNINYNFFAHHNLVHDVNSYGITSDDNYIYILHLYSYDLELKVIDKNTYLQVSNKTLNVNKGNYFNRLNNDATFIVSNDKEFIYVLMYVKMAGIYLTWFKILKDIKNPVITKYSFFNFTCSVNNSLCGFKLQHDKNKHKIFLSTLKTSYLSNKTVNFDFDIKKGSTLNLDYFQYLNKKFLNINSIKIDDDRLFIVGSRENKSTTNLGQSTTVFMIYNLSTNEIKERVYETNDFNVYINNESYHPYVFNLRLDLTNNRVIIYNQVSKNHSYSFITPNTYNVWAVNLNTLELTGITDPLFYHYFASNVFEHNNELWFANFIEKSKTTTNFVTDLLPDIFRLTTPNNGTLGWYSQGSWSNTNYSNAQFDFDRILNHTVIPIGNNQFRIISSGYLNTNNGLMINLQQSSYNSKKLYHFSNSIITIDTSNNISIDNEEVYNINSTSDLNAYNSLKDLTNGYLEIDSNKYILKGNKLLQVNTTTLNLNNLPSLNIDSPIHGGVAHFFKAYSFPIHNTHILVSHKPYYHYHEFPYFDNDKLNSIFNEEKYWLPLNIIPIRI